jgi:hypothetical protein
VKPSTLWVVHAGVGALSVRVSVGRFLLAARLYGSGYSGVSSTGTELEALPCESYLHTEPEAYAGAHKSALERVSGC